MNPPSFNTAHPFTSTNPFATNFQPALNPAANGGRAPIVEVAVRRPKPPKVTLGMPVYNGEQHIERAILSILAQTFTDFRLIILDNASIDRTAQIAKAYAEKDPRITYFCNDRNIGAHPNFNRVFTLSESEYFKWAAHDDEIHPHYLELCVKALDANPRAAVVHTCVEEINEAGDVTRVYTPLPDATADVDPLIRFRTRVQRRGWCTELFGLMRASALRKTALLGSFASADLSMLTELTLTGSVMIVPKPLFRNRRHPGRYTDKLFEKAVQSAQRRQLLNWHDTSKKDRRWAHLHWWALFFSYFKMVDRQLPIRKRFAYYRAAFSWLKLRNNRADLAKDLLFLASPRLFEWTFRKRIKEAIAAKNTAV